MFLLFLCLGAASVKAQVRIGGNTAPDASAVLDLNANDTNNGTKGLALPRVGLTSNTMLLPGVTANLTGMLVYNTTTTGGAGVNTIGIYFWNGATWVKASLPSTSAADSGKFLMSNGSTWVANSTLNSSINNNDSIKTYQSLKPMNWSLFIDTTITITTKFNTYTEVYVVGVTNVDVCVPLTDFQLPILWVGANKIHVWRTQNGSSTMGMRFRCYRPSI